VKVAFVSALLVFVLGGAYWSGRASPRASWFARAARIVVSGLFLLGRSAGRLYARAAGMRFSHRHWLAGTATNWQNHHLLGSVSFTVELPVGRLSPQQLRGQVRAVLTLGGALRGPAHA
jgi:hypothetical protein